MFRLFIDIAIPGTEVEALKAAAEAVRAKQADVKDL
jgi:hypothetical protein